MYGYHVNEGKSCVIVKNESHATRAKEIFVRSGITASVIKLGTIWGSIRF